jgi:hypothetical protein
MLNVALIEEWSIINGDSSVDPLQFDGLNKQIALNAQDCSTAALALSDITAVCRKIVEKGGKPQAVVVGYRELQKISDLVLSSYYRLFQAGAGTMADVPSGVSVSRWLSPFGLVDIIGSRYITPVGEDELSFALVIDDKTVLEDGNAVQMVDLMPLSAIDLALMQSAYRTLIAEFTVLQLTCEAFQGRIDNIGPTVIVP